MTLQNLIDQQLLKNFNEASIYQVRKKFERGASFLNYASTLYKSKAEDPNTNIIIYTNIYSAVRITGETFLLLNGYKTTLREHHKTVIKAARLIMNREGMDNIFNRLDRMRKNRNKIEYDVDTLDISKQTLLQAIEDTKKFMDEVGKWIDEKNTQTKLQI